MDNVKLSKLPMEWVDRLFERMTCIYKEKWTDEQGNPKKSHLYRTIWSTGLTGLTTQEIRYALEICRSGDNLFPPTVVEFYHYAKGITMPVFRKMTNIERGNTEIAKHYLNEIKTKVNNKQTI